MMKRMQQLVDEFDYSSTASIFSTKNQVTSNISCFHCGFHFQIGLLSFSPLIPALFFLQRQLTDDYFFDSVERISFFFEGMNIN